MAVASSVYWGGGGGGGGLSATASLCFRQMDRALEAADESKFLERREGEEKLV